MMQGYPLTIETEDGRRWLVVGWVEYGYTSQPIVMEIGSWQEGAKRMPHGTAWTLHGWEAVQSDD